MIARFVVLCKKFSIIKIGSIVFQVSLFCQEKTTSDLFGGQTLPPLFGWELQLLGGESLAGRFSFAAKLRVFGHRKLGRGLGVGVSFEY